MSKTILSYPFAFDEAFYRRSYHDLDDVADLTAHFLEVGYEERRYSSEAQLHLDINTVAASGTFDADYFRLNYGPSPNAIRHYLLRWQFDDIKPSAAFDVGFVQDYYGRTLAPGENPYAFYSRHAKLEWCFPSLTAAEAALGHHRHSEYFDSASERRYLMKGVFVDPFIYYCTEGFRALEPASKRFDTRAYLLHYPDIASVCINPLLHYIEFGQKEGRHAFPRSKLVRHKGRRVDVNKKTLLIASHEASRSGAPIVGINLARHFIEDYNVVSLLFRAGPLFVDFVSVSTEVFIAGDDLGDIASALAVILGTHEVTAAILNSAECAKCLAVLVEQSVPVVSLIHEFAQYMTSLKFLEKSLILSDAVVFPAEVVKAEALKEVARLGLVPAHPNHLHVRPQGRSMLPPHDRRNDDQSLDLLRRLLDRPNRPLVVLAAGYVQPRKGVDLFIETARVMRHDLKTDCLFIWVGGNYRPKDDMVVSVYLAAQVEQSGVTDCVLFMDELSTLDGVWPYVDAFLLSSRLDPFPNVALDAIFVGVPVVCFQSATGIAELAETWPDRVQAAPFGDIRSAAEMLLRMGRGGKRPITPTIEKLLSFAEYATFIDGLVKGAITRIASKVSLGRRLIDAGFDSALFDGSVPAWLKQPGFGLGPDASSKVLVAVTAALNGLNVGLLKPGHAAVLDVGPDGHDFWRSGEYRVIDPSRTIQTDFQYGAIFFTDSDDFLRSISKVLFLLPYPKRVTIVTSSIDGGRLDAIRSLLEGGDVELVRISATADRERISEALRRKYTGFDCVHLVVETASISADTPANFEPEHWMGCARSAAAALANDPQLQSVFARADKLATKRWADLRLRADAVVGIGPLVERMVDADQVWLRPSNGEFGRLLADIYGTYFQLGDGRRLFHRLCDRHFAVSYLERWAVVEHDETIHVPFVDLGYGRLSIMAAVQPPEAAVRPLRQVIYGRRGSQRPVVRRLAEAELQLIQLLYPSMSAGDWNVVEVKPNTGRALVHPIQSETTVAILRGLPIAGVTAVSARVTIDRDESNDVEFALAAVRRRVRYDDPCSLITQWHRVSPGQVQKIDGSIEIADDSSTDILLATRMFADNDPQLAWAYFSDLTIST